MFIEFLAFLGAVLAGQRSALVVSLALACVFVVVLIPIYAFRGKLHIPGYVGLAFLTFAIALLFGKIAGSRAVTGTIGGVLLSVLFFLLIATALGSILALFFYRHPPEV